MGHEHIDLPLAEDGAKSVRVVSTFFIIHHFSWLILKLSGIVIKLTLQGLTSNHGLFSSLQSCM